MSDMPTHISFKNVLFEVNNPELFELDEAQELAFIIMKDFMQASSDMWEPISNAAFPDAIYIDKYINHNQRVRDYIRKNPGKLPRNPFIFKYINFQVDENIINQMKMKGTLNPDLSNIGALFIQKVYPAGYNIPSTEAPATFGESAPGSTIVAVVYDQTHTLAQISQALTSVLVHEMNHDYDRTEYDAGASQGDYFAVNNIQQTPEQEKSLKKILDLINLPIYKNIIPQGLINGIQWITNIWELKSITKQFIKDCEYKSVDYKNTSNPDVHIELNKWLEVYMNKKFNLTEIISRTTDTRSSNALVYIIETVFNHVKSIMLYILNALNAQQKIRFR